jgi:superoxide dismutase, Fe-Mn family
MTIHHSKHHQAYVDKLNDAISKNPSLANLKLEDLLRKAVSSGAAVKNNAGGHYNHSLFWKLMDPAGKGSVPSKELLQKINKQYGSLDRLKEVLNSAAMSCFGSGWAWLFLNKDRNLEITTTANQDNLIMDGIGAEGAQTLIGIDVWEHAYYLKYQNNRADYLKKWWEVINWKEVNNLYLYAI